MSKTRFRRTLAAPRADRRFPAFPALAWRITVAPLSALGLFAALTAAPLSAQAGGSVAYDVSFPNAAHHELEITATWTGLPAGRAELWMSRSSPGRYAVHEFAKNVYNLRAEDGKGRPLAVTGLNPYSWGVTGHDGTVRVHYTLFADRGDGTYAQIDRTHGHLNMPATFMWAKGFDERPIRVTFRDLPAGWKVATQLRPTTDPMTFTAPGLQLFMDSPITLGPIDIRSWLVNGAGGRTDTMRLAIDHLGTAAEVDRFVEMIKKVVQEEAGVFGELAPYDWGTYTFLSDYLPWASGDGMEHRNSTSLTSTRSLATSMPGLLGTVAHEFFHSWNVERIRPRGIEPFDFSQANMTGELWLAEGFTNYYGDLAMRRAGFEEDAPYAQSLGRTVDAIVNGPGRRYFSAADMSRQAPFVDAAQSIDLQNKSNTFISYYTFGEGIAAGLDLTLRTRFQNLSLDDFMRAMWRKYGKTEKAYTQDDVQATLAEVTGDMAFAADYVRRYIAGREVPDYAALFAGVGMKLRMARPGVAWLGDVALQNQGAGVTLGTATLVGQPIYEAGLDRGDLIRSVEGRPLTSTVMLDSIVAAHTPGDKLAIEFESRRAGVKATLTLKENPRLELVLMESVGETPSAAAMAARRRWLDSKAGNAGAPK